MLINAIGTYSASQPLESMAITRRDPGPQDVQIAIAYCGIAPGGDRSGRRRSKRWRSVHPAAPGRGGGWPLIPAAGWRGREQKR